jgi:hypothetical protein
MREEEFQAAVQAVVAAHPDWAPGIGEAARRGLLERVQRDAQRATDMETIAMLALDRLVLRKLRPRDRDLLLEKLRPWQGSTAFKWDSVLAQLAEYE